MVNNVWDKVYKKVTVLFIVIHKYYVLCFWIIILVCTDKKQKQKTTPWECFAYTVLYQTWWKNTLQSFGNMCFQTQNWWDLHTEHTTYIHMLSLDFFTSCQLYRVISRWTGTQARTYMPTHNICMHTNTLGCPPTMTKHSNTYTNITVLWQLLETQTKDFSSGDYTLPR